LVTAWVRLEWLRTQQSGETGNNNNDRGKTGRGWFFPNFDNWFLLPQCMEFTPIYKGWKRDILSLSITNLGPWFSLEGSQPFKVAIMNCQILTVKKLFELASLGWHYGRCGINQQEETILGHGQMVKRRSIKCP